MYTSLAITSILNKIKSDLTDYFLINKFFPVISSGFLKGDDIHHYIVNDDVVNLGDRWSALLWSRSVLGKHDSFGRRHTAVSSKLTGTATEHVIKHASCTINFAIVANSPDLIEGIEEKLNISLFHSGYNDSPTLPDIGIQTVSFSDFTPESFRKEEIGELGSMTVLEFSCKAGFPIAFVNDVGGNGGTVNLITQIKESIYNSNGTILFSEDTING